MEDRHIENTFINNKPWYQQFWPWFLILLPASVVVAGFSTLYIALKNPHSMVNDQYYREGLAINQSLEQDRRAAELGLSAKLSFGDGYVDIVLAGRGDQLSDYSSQDFPAQLILLMLHPGSQTLDQRLQLEHLKAGHYRIELSSTYQYSYYLRLMPKDKSWRLNGKINFQSSDAAALGFQ